MGDFCGMCHVSKADPGALTTMEIFGTMDHRNTPSAPPASKPASKPVRVKKK
jgi:hypothetical protein